MRSTRVFWLGLAVLYPVLVFFGLKSGLWGPRHIGLLLLVMAALRLALRSSSGNGFAERWLVVPPLLLALPALWLNQEIWILIYPVLISVMLLAIFTISLLRPPAIIESIARLQHPELDADGVRYARKVTQVWCLFFLLNGSIALWSVFASREIWVLYNGAISYALMGLLFAGEWLVRRRVLARKVL